jgi:hypothetical protein
MSDEKFSLTLRDYFAVQLADKVGNWPEQVGLKQVNDPEFYKYCTYAARACYFLADAMLIERNKTLGELHE